MVKDLVFMGLGGLALAWIVGFFAQWEAYRRGYRTAVRDLWAQKFARRGESPRAGPQQQEER